MALSPIREISALDLAPLRQQNEFGFGVQAGLDKKIDLNFAGVKTQHATHSIHPYVAAINPPLAEALIQHYVPVGATILDPFCGGGGVLVEGILNNRRVIGCDINPLAVLLSRVKTTHISAEKSKSCFDSILKNARSYESSVSVDDVPDVVKFWYFDYCLKPLKSLQLAILGIKDESLRELFKAVLSATARDVMLTYRGEIRLRKMNGKELERFKPDVFIAFEKRALSAMERVASLPQKANSTVYSLDCRKLTATQKCHTVITSPPYGDDKNGVGYFQFSRNMLYWIGIPLDEQKKQRESFLGGKLHPDNHTELSPTLQETLKIIAVNKAAHFDEAASFYGDYYNALDRIASVTKHRVIVIIGDRVLSRTKINNGHITTEFMQALGWNLEHYYTRQLLKKRIANLGGDGGGISLEHIMVFSRT